MSNDIFINRVEEKAQLTKELIEPSAGSKLIILSAPSGRGKSALVDQVIANCEITNFVRVKIMDHEKYRDVDGSFVLELGRSLDKFARENSPSNQSSTTITKHHVVEAIIDTARVAFIDYIEKKTGSKKLSNSISDLIGKFSKDNSDAIFSGHDELYEPIKKYINAFLKNYPFTVVLENIQNIDKDSLEFFKVLLNEHSDLNIVAEFTNSTNELYKENQLFDYLGGDSVFKAMHRLGVLPVKDIIKFLKQDELALAEVFESSYSSSDGNLYKLSFILKSARKDTVFSLKDDAYQTFENTINSLNEQHKLLLAIIATHGGRVSLEILNRLMNSTPQSKKMGLHYKDLQAATLQLSNNDLLKIALEEICLKHDSALQIIFSNESYFRHLMIANDLWFKFYVSLKAESTQDFLLPLSEILGWELYYRSQLDLVDGLIDTLEKIYTLCLTSRAPRRTIRFAQNLRSRLIASPNSSEEIIKTIDLYLARIFYRLSMFEEVIEYTKSHLEETEPLLMCSTSTLLSGDSVAASSLLDKYVTTPDEDKIRWLGSQLVRIAILRASNQYDECSELWWELHEKQAFKNSSLEPLFKRSSDMALIGGGERRIQFLSEAISTFQNNNESIQEMGARIALSQHLGYGGLLDKAEEELKKADEIIKGTISNSFILSNNFAVISLYKNKANDQCLAQLEEASEHCNNHLSKLIILNNLLIWHSINETFDAKLSIQESIEEILSKYKDIDYDLTRIAFFNIAMSIEQPKARQEYIERARSLPVNADFEYWRVKLYDELPQRDDFRYQYKYYPVFISSWSLDFDIALKNC
ncbi:hypothetical protein [Thalassomonas sp. RHCl1]|uniref:hypothetical protein n=1 Tax=Thalassomonas sp. RHCl1 TaxID=2995320 RepID=UPI00248B13B0|nr:hypothetical protein [Thalassomonas sp. RHCl1]